MDEQHAHSSEAVWLVAQQLFPNWPGFAPERRSAELREQCAALKSKALEEVAKLFDP